MGADQVDNGNVATLLRKAQCAHAVTVVSVYPIKISTRKDSAADCHAATPGCEMQRCAPMLICGVHLFEFAVREDHETTLSVTRDHSLNQCSIAKRIYGIDLCEARVGKDLTHSSKGRGAG